MCGIIGILGHGPVAGDMIDALRRLEYRGYDSAGIATVQGGRLARLRAEGKLRNLEARLAESPLTGSAGIGHTRWATHGRPNETNAHPHMTARVSVVHNGIIENFRVLRDELTAAGYAFSSDTDTEAVAQLMTFLMDRGASPAEAMRATLARLEGAFALAVLVAGDDDLLLVARRGSPLVIGFKGTERYVGSDAIALAPFTSDIAYLEEGDWAVVRRSQVTIYDAAGRAVERPVIKSGANAFLVDKGNHRHFMLKEIHEQPDVVSRTLAHYVNLSDFDLSFPEFGADVKALPRITISACGTAYYAGLVGKYWIERLARIPVEIDVASEMRYREAPLPENGLAISISQSGETADTLATLRYSRTQGQRIAAIVNVPTSTIAREADVVLPTLAGPEIGVAFTKAFTCQLTTLACLAIHFGVLRGTIDAQERQRLIEALASVPRLMAELLRDEAPYTALANRLSHARDVLYLGRGMAFPIALEGALKLKEISYIHAEAYAAGELKHGPIALIDEDVPVVVIAPQDALFEKTVSNMQEVAARGGRIILVSNADAAQVGCEVDTVLAIPACDPFVAPLVAAIPMQLIAYHTAVHLGTDVDQPRNLAKSVTVE